MEKIFASGERFASSPFVLQRRVGASHGCRLLFAALCSPSLAIPLILLGFIDFSFGRLRSPQEPDTPPELLENSSDPPKPSKSTRDYSNTPLQQVTEAYYERMPARVKTKHLQLVQAAIDYRIEKQDILVASACSGSDIGVVCFETLIGVLNEKLGFSEGECVTCITTCLRSHPILSFSLVGLLVMVLFFV